MVYIHFSSASISLVTFRGAYEAVNYRNTVDLNANYRRTVGVFHVIPEFRLRLVV